MALALNGSTGISGVDGSASAPSVVGSDSNTGFAFAADTVLFNTAGAERGRIDSGGRFLLGKTSGTSALFQVDEGAQVFGAANDGNSSCLTLDYSSGTGRIMGHGSSGGALAFFTNASGAGVTQKMHIASDGNVGIGKTSSSLDIDGSLFFGNGQAFQMVKSGSGGKIFTLNRRTNVGLSIEFFRGSSVGSISHNNTSTAFNTTSDYRLKENVVALSDAITRLKTLKPYRFNFKIDKDTTVDGFLAHEVTAVPEAIQGEKDAVITQEMIDNEEYEKERLGEILPQGIDQAKLVPLLTAALQEAVGKIETLETKVTALEAA